MSPTTGTEIDSETPKTISFTDFLFLRSTFFFILTLIELPVNKWLKWNQRQLLLLLLLDVTTLIMARKPVKFQKESPAGYAGEGKQSEGNIEEKRMVLR